MECQGPDRNGMGNMASADDRYLNPLNVLFVILCMLGSKINLNGLHLKLLPSSKTSVEYRLVKLCYDFRNLITLPCDCPHLRCNDTYLVA